MCHVNRLTPTQRRTLEAMPKVYGDILIGRIEAAPQTQRAIRELFTVWAARLEGVDNARRVEEVTREVIAEAREAYFIRRGLISTS